MRCPECGGRGLVTSTFDEGATTRRYRRCVVCGHRWRAWEENDAASIRKRRTKAEIEADQGHREDLFTHAEKRAKSAG